MIAARGSPGARQAGTSARARGSSLPSRTSSPTQRVQEALRDRPRDQRARRARARRRSARARAGRARSRPARGSCPRRARRQREAARQLAGGHSCVGQSVPLGRSCAHRRSGPAARVASVSTLRAQDRELLREVLDLECPRARAAPRSSGRSRPGTARRGRTPSSSASRRRSRASARAARRAAATRTRARPRRAARSACTPRAARAGAPARAPPRPARSEIDSASQRVCFEVGVVEEQLAQLRERRRLVHRVLSSSACGGRRAHARRRGPEREQHLVHVPDRAQARRAASTCARTRASRTAISRTRSPWRCAVRSTSTSG